MNTLDGVNTGRYTVTTENGTRYLIDLDTHTAIRQAAEPIHNVTGGHLTANGQPFHWLSRNGPTIGWSMRLDNMDEWRISTPVTKIKEGWGRGN